MLARLAQPVIETWDFEPTRRPLQIGFSHHQVGRDAATYLADRGYRRIAFVHNVVPDLSAHNRCAGFAQVMAERGLPAGEYRPQAATPMEGGAQALQAFTSKGRRRHADALFFANDNLAFGAVLAAQRLGVRIPQDVAVFGFGDYAMADRLMPSLSTIRPPAQAIGEVAARHILQLVGGDAQARAAVPHATALGCDLIARESA